MDPGEMNSVIGQYTWEYFKQVAQYSHEQTYMPELRFKPKHPGLESIALVACNRTLDQLASSIKRHVSLQTRRFSEQLCRVVQKNTEQKQVLFVSLQTEAFSHTATSNYMNVFV
jgi:hypothetical protein